MEQPATTFANHRGVAPLLWAFFALACMEMLAMHLFVALKWPGVAWPLTAVTALSIVWLVRWIGSWPRLPHELRGDVLTLHMGSLRHYAVPVASIAGVRTAVSNDVLKAPGTVSLVPVAFPNRIVDLTAPLPGRRRVQHIAIRLDDPAAFDAAMAGLGIAVG